MARDLGTVSEVISAYLSTALHVWLQCGERIPWSIEPVCFVAQGGDLERNAASNGKPVQITKEIEGALLLTYGYIASDSSKLVLDSLHPADKMLSFMLSVYFSTNLFFIHLRAARMINDYRRISASGVRVAASEA